MSGGDKWVSTLKQLAMAASGSRVGFAGMGTG